MATPSLVSTLLMVGVSVITRSEILPGFQISQAGSS